MTSKTYCVTYMVGKGVVTVMSSLSLEEIERMGGVVSVTEEFSTVWNPRWTTDQEWITEWRNYWADTDRACANIE